MGKHRRISIARSPSGPSSSAANAAGRTFRARSVPRALSCVAIPKPTAGKLTNRWSPPAPWRSCFLAPLLALIALALTAGTALAASPETPFTREPKSITATTAVLNGELNPGAPDHLEPLESETYEFAYAPSGSECTAAGGLVAPEPAAMALGEAGENVAPLTVTGLEGSTEYAFCVVAINTPFGGSPEPTYAAPEIFTTLPAAPKIEGPLAPPTAVTPFEESLEASVNPENQPTTSCVFEYGKTTDHEQSVKCSPSVLEGASDTPASASVAGLKAATKYHYRIVVKNATGQTESAGEFTTAAEAAPAVEGETVSGVSSTGAKLEAQVNPNYQKTTYEFEYSTSEAEVLAGKGTPVAAAGALEGFGGQTASATTGVLAPGTTYYYRVLATNATGTTDGAVQSFTAVPLPHGVKGEGVTATTASFTGDLTPLNEKVATKYSFAYNVGAACAGGLTTPETEEEAGKGTGTAAVGPEAVTELQPNAEYAVCLVASNEFGSETSAPITFKTLVAGPKIDSEGTSGVTPYEATLEAQVNPNNQKTTYKFEYSTSATGETLNAPVTTLPGGPALEGYGEQTASAPTGHVLTPGSTYYFRVIAENAKGETEEGKVEKVETPALSKPTIEGESASAITPFDATLEATVNPDYQITTIAFEYATEQSVLLKKAGTTVSAPSLPAAGPGQPDSVALNNVLQAGTKYFYRVVAANGTGTTENKGVIATFQTLPAAAPKIVGESAAGIQATVATLEAEINPEGAATTTHFEYLTEAQFKANGKTFTGAQNDARDQARRVAHGSGHRHRQDHASGTRDHLPLPSRRDERVGGKTETMYGEDKTLTTPATPSSEPSQGCENEARRAEQPFGQTLPDCRAYEMVSPVQSDGQDATDASIAILPRAAVSGEALAYASRGTFGTPAGGNLENELISRREANGWGTQNVTPLYNPLQTLTDSAYGAVAFTPDLGEGLVSTSASLLKEAPAVPGEYDLYLAGFAAHEYRYIAQSYYPMGASTDLSRVVFGETGEVSEWQDGAGTVPVSVSNEGEALNAGVGDAAEYQGARRDKDVWHAVSGDGSRVYFTSPGFEQGSSGARLPDNRQLYVRVNTEQSQSRLLSPEANANGALTAGSEVVTALVPALAAEGYGVLTAGSTEVTGIRLKQEFHYGYFSAGQSVSGPDIPPNTTITKVSGATLTLSAPAEASTEDLLSSYRSASFTAGQKIAGYGIPPGTTVSAVGSVGSGELTLSKPAGVSGSEIALDAGGECTEPAQACTVDVSASQRATPDTHGLHSARYWGASADGSRTFFTSTSRVDQRLLHWDRRQRREPLRVRSAYGWADGSDGRTDRQHWRRRRGTGRGADLRRRPVRLLRR